MESKAAILTHNTAIWATDHKIEKKKRKKNKNLKKSSDLAFLKRCWSTL
jgi:hypothetical protein